MRGRCGCRCSRPAGHRLGLWLAQEMGSFYACLAFGCNAPGEDSLLPVERRIRDHASARGFFPWRLWENGKRSCSILDAQSTGSRRVELNSSPSRHVEKSDETKANSGMCAGTSTAVAKLHGGTAGCCFLPKSHVFRSMFRRRLTVDVQGGEVDGHLRSTQANRAGGIISGELPAVGPNPPCHPASHVGPSGSRRRLRSFSEKRKRSRCGFKTDFAGGRKRNRESLLFDLASIYGHYLHDGIALPNAGIAWCASSIHIAMDAFNRFVPLPCLRRSL